MRPVAAALAEVLRAPLLLTPLADVASGWVLIEALRPSGGAAGPDAELTAVVGGVVGCCLLAAGMAQNAWLDLADDRERKPQRPLPRGALSLRTVILVCVLLSVAALGLAAWRRPLLVPAAAIVVLSAAYHGVLKRWRLAGCLALGGLRALCMGLGAVAAGGTAALPLMLGGCGLYGLYIFGASWHASTDDRPGARGACWPGIGLCLATLAALALAAWSPSVPGTAWQAALADVVLLYGIARLVHSARQHAPPRITGVALSGLHLLHAGLVTALGRPLVALGVLLLFGCSRLALRRFPPS